MSSRFAHLSSAGLISVLALLTGCSVGPDYVQPTVPKPVSYKEAGTWKKPTPIGFYFAKLWYFEKLYPMIFTVAALGRRLSSLDDGPTTAN